MSDTPQTEPSLYAAREPIFPRRVTGWFRTFKWWIMAVTLGIYYITPWIRWDRGPDLPDQAVLVDMANRRFYFFFIEIWPQEFYFIAGLLIMAGLGLFLFTAALGRVWCGYTCPQTVWTDLFILVERWIEGDRNARVRLWKEPWTPRKIRLRVTKFAVWILISVATGGAWVFYFADAPTLLVDLFTGNAPAAAYISVLVLTATTFTFGGLMREQVCIYMCPWPRIQGAMMDEQTITVGYREWRGEPRGKHRRRKEMAEKAAAAVATNRAAGPAEGPKSPNLGMPGMPSGVGGPIPQKETLGDCIDCNACVNVCPMGIDIRDGQQLACITCALCIDACDDVMAKIGKPRGLIDYITLEDGEAERRGEEPVPVWRRILRPRVILYTVLWGGIGVGLLAALVLRTDLSFSVEPVRNPINVVLSDGAVRNAYELRLRNMTGYERTFDISVASEYPLALNLQGADGSLVTVPADETWRQRIYLTSEPGSPGIDLETFDVELSVQDTSSSTRAIEETVFHGNPQ
ncbi:cytochrome c oxidase accessory protein CcoG [Amaricoccus macauensis]|uniref:cytochrome c oxidase accessory protein CcoG n=1 Tax=Amaricoccus macauensis TaxID=57001 RepID=UPI003C7D771B